MNKWISTKVHCYLQIWRSQHFTRFSHVHLQICCTRNFNLPRTVNLLTTVFSKLYIYELRFSMQVGWLIRMDALNFLSLQFVLKLSSATPGATPATWLWLWCQAFLWLIHFMIMFYATSYLPNNPCRTVLTYFKNELIQFHQQKNRTIFYN